MGPEAAINAVFRRHIDKIPPGAEREKFIAEKRAQYQADIDVHVMADQQVVDHVVPPSELRDELVAFEVPQAPGRCGSRRPA